MKQASVYYVNRRLIINMLTHCEEESKSEKKKSY
jgi:hypothetical protein